MQADINWVLVSEAKGESSRDTNTHIRKNIHGNIYIIRIINIFVRMFERVVLQTNLGNTKAMVCTPGFIWGEMEAAAYKQRVTGKGATFR